MSNFGLYGNIVNGGFMKLFDCDCDYVESGKGVGSVKGYVLVTECAVCAAKRVNDAEIEAGKKLIRDEINAKNALIKKHLDEMAIEELKIDGKLTSEGLVVK
jgi:hypothetical protein